MSATPPPTDEQALSPRRRELLDAALHVVADQGLRGLTHRAVDRQAGLPEGSCSGYLRTRQALLAALTAYVAGSLTADVAALARELEGCDELDDRAIELTTGLFLRWLAERELLQAKLELSMQAARDPELAALLATSRSELIGVVDRMLAGRGRAHSNELAEAMVASYDGILAAALLKPPDARQEFLVRSSALVMASVTASVTAG